jgi:hypothetical protein
MIQSFSQAEVRIPSMARGNLVWCLRSSFKKSEL